MGGTALAVARSFGFRYAGMEGAPRGGGGDGGAVERWAWFANALLAELRLRAWASFAGAFLQWFGRRRRLHDKKTGGHDNNHDHDNAMRTME